MNVSCADIFEINYESIKKICNDVEATSVPHHQPSEESHQSAWRQR